MGFMASYHPHITFIPTSVHWTYLQYCVQVLRRGGAGQGLPQQVGAHSALKLRTGGGKLRKAGGQGLPDRWALEFLNYLDGCGGGGVVFSWPSSR